MKLEFGFRVPNHLTLVFNMNYFRLLDLQEEYRKAPPSSAKRIEKRIRKTKIDLERFYKKLL